MSLDTMVSFLTNLSTLSAKLPYQLDMIRSVLDKAIGAGDRAAISECLARGYLADGTVNPGLEEENWMGMAQGDLVEIKGAYFMFPKIN